MHPYLKVFLWLSSCCFFSSCVSVKNRSLLNVFTQCPPVYEHHLTDGRYNTKIDFHNRHFSGILVFKNMNDTTKRVVFITETGFKFFDFELTPQRFEKVYVVKNLDKKFVLHVLEKDFRMILFAPNDKNGVEQINDPVATVLKFPEKAEKFTTYYSDKKCNSLQRITYGSKNKIATQIDLEKGSSKSFEKIYIQHKQLGLTMDLKRMVDEME